MAKTILSAFISTVSFSSYTGENLPVSGSIAKALFKDDAGNLSFVVYGDLLRTPRGIYADVFFFGLKYFLVARRHGVARFKAEHLNVRCAETVSIARAVYRNVTAADYHNITGE